MLVTGLFIYMNIKILIFKVIEELWDFSGPVDKFRNTNGAYAIIRLGRVKHANKKNMLHHKPNTMEKSKQRMKKTKHRNLSSNHPTIKKEGKIERNMSN